jgi:outer membrane protein
MSSKRKVCALSVWAALGLARAATGEDLQDAWRLALDRDQALAATHADAEAALANEDAARAARWPTLEATAGYTRLDQAPALAISTPAFTLRSPPIFAGDDFVTAGGRIVQPLYAGGRITAGIEAARSATAGANADERSVTASVKLETARAYVTVLRARRASQTAESRVASLTAHASDVQHLVDRELVAMSDLLAARVARANAEEARVRAANAVSIAEAAYNRRVGQPLDRVPELAEPEVPDAALAAEPLDVLLQRALDSRNEPKGMTARSDELAAQAHAEAGRLLPQLTLTGSYQYFENEILDRQNASAVGLAVQWNVFDAGRSRSLAGALRSSSRAMARRADDLRSQIELEVRAAWLDVAEARARKQSTEETVAQSEENLRTTRELYGAGLGTSTQVLDAVSLQVTARNNRNDAALDEILSLLRLAYATGTL